MISLRERLTRLSDSKAAVARRASIAAALTLGLSMPLAGVGMADAPTPQSVRTQDSEQAPATRLELLRPTGPYAIGRDTLHLVDNDRRDPWMPQAGARELMVSMYYPARPGTGDSAPYMTTEEARLLLKGLRRDGVIPTETVSTTLTHARAAARPLPGRFPLVVLSPGFTMPRATLSGLAGDLASRGYVVATVDHAYESFGTLFPGGRMLTCAACAPVDAGGDAGYKAAAEGRAKDITFLLDRLTDHRPAWRHARMIDARRIGAAGHSIGGNSAAQTMATDRRVRAGVNLDGSFYAPVPTSGLEGRPFLMLGTKADHSPGVGSPSWDGDWARLDGWKRWLTVADSGHLSFTDLPVLGGQLGLTDPSAPLPGRRSGEITRDYVGAFFDQHLRGIRQPLLDGPSTANPEVEFQRP
ncbi:alpha/beta hydrolase [Streptomyces sp. NPDC000410]|uniref:alpha/beta hydrolase family protein n=1 Tax=Streptomyces sp. NPDC000410 TaxID=3154254 RepID=UPI003333F638